MRITRFIIAMVLISGVIVGMYGFANTLSKEEHYNTSIDDSYQDRYNKIDQLQNISKDLQEKTRDVTTDKDQSFFTGTWDAFKLGKDILIGAVKSTGTALDIAFSFATGFISDIGINEEGGYLTSIITTILTILVVGAAIYIITKRVF